MSERENLNEIDERLNSAAQHAMRAVVGGLPEDSLSMAWRSTLNERILAEAATRQKRSRMTWFLRPALGLGLAGALAVAVFFHGPSSAPQSHRTEGAVARVATPSDGSLEAELVNTHRQTSLAYDVAGVGVTVNEVSYDSSSSAPHQTGWSEDDLENL